MALKETGCLVDIVCPDGHPVTKTSAAHRTYSFNGLRPLGSFSKATIASKPDLLIPCDDLATILLYKLYRQSLARNLDQMVRILKISLGNLSTQAVCCSRVQLIELAAALGIRSADTAAVTSTEAFRDWLAKFGLPAVLKADGTSGGVGVRVVSTREEAERAFKRLSAPPLVLRAAKRAVVDFDLNLVAPCVRRQRSMVSIQRFIKGREATSTIVSWQGSVLANLSFEVLRTWEARGPATVVQSIHNREMFEAAELLARRLNLSGIYGFDFVLQDATEYPYLIEMNSRATQTSHLALGPGRDLAAAIYAAVSEEPIANRKMITDRDVIALFPAEWKNAPTSPFLISGYHDVPWSEPALVKACILERPRRAEWMSSMGWTDSREVVSQCAPQTQQPLVNDDGAPVNVGSPHA
jgi:hypothetical protein